MSAQDPTEMFDVVDENDVVTGSKPRSEVHAQKLLHRAVHILLYNKQGQLYLQRRSPNKDQFPDCWDSSCSGHVDSGEEYDDAAERELLEELGVSHNRVRLRKLFKLPASPETNYEFIWVYQSICEGPFILNPDEISDGRFFNADEIESAITEDPKQFAGAFLHLWPKLALGA